MDSQDKNKNSKKTSSDNEDDDTNEEKSTAQLSESNKQTVITLEGSHIGSTDTEALDLKEAKRVSFKEEETEEQSSTSQLNSIFKSCTSQDDENFASAENAQSFISPQNESEDIPITDQPRRSSDTRMQHILNLLDNFTRNLETIEDHIISTNSKSSTPPPTPPPSPQAAINFDDVVRIQTSRFEIHHEKATPQIEAHECRSSKSSRRSSWSSISSPRRSSDVRITQILQSPSYAEPYTELVDRGSEAERAQSTYIVNLTSNAAYSAEGPPSAMTKKQSIPNIRPPCELTYHTITINTSPSLPTPVPRRPETFGARIGRTIADFMAALCLCLQVNKDCVFCLGFFVAFVVSASFLTAFFYRTLSLTPQTIRIRQEEYVTENFEPTTLRLNGFYYIYNHRNHPNFG